MILNLCKDPDLLEFMVIANAVVLLMRIFVPVIVIIFGSFELLKAVSSQDSDAFKKAKSGLLKKIVAMTIVFLVPTIIDFSISLFDEKYDIAACWTNGTRSKVDSLYKSLADSSIKTAQNAVAKKNFKSNDAREYYDKAVKYVNKLKDGKVKDGYKKTLNEILTKIQKKEEEEKNDDSMDSGVSDKTDEDDNPDAPKGNGTTTDNNPTDSEKSTNGNITDSKYTGKIPFFTQGSGASWAKVNFCVPVYRNGHDEGTIAYQGCGATSLAMVINGYGNNKSVNPKTIRDYVCSNGHHSGGLAHNFFTKSDLMNKYNVKSETLFSSKPSQSTGISKIEGCLKKGGSAIVNVPGHYLVVDSINASGQMHVLDPSTRYKTVNKWYTGADLWNNVLHHYVAAKRYPSDRPSAAWCYTSK